MWNDLVLIAGKETHRRQFITPCNKRVTETLMFTIFRASPLACSSAFPQYEYFIADLQPFAIHLTHKTLIPAWYTSSQKGQLQVLLAQALFAVTLAAASNKARILPSANGSQTITRGALRSSGHRKLRDCKRQMNGYPALFPKTQIYSNGVTAKAENIELHAGNTPHRNTLPTRDPGC